MNINLKEIFDDQNILDKKSLDFLIKAIEKNNQSGFDYLEFKQALIRLHHMKVDQNTAILSAFATASTVGLTKGTLLESADYYLNVLKEEYKQFNTALNKQMDAKVHSREKQKASLVSKKENLEKKIEILTAELNEVNKKLTNIDKEAEAARNKIEETHERFGNTLNALTKRIETDIEIFKSKLS